MCKTIKIIPPYIHPGHLNFKYQAFEGLRSHGLSVGQSLYPWKILHHWAFLYELPLLFQNEKNAMLMFVEPISISFDTFPYYATHEVIPFIWDCWPCYFDKMEAWFKKHNTRAAIFTSRMEMKEMQQRCPDVKMLWCPEAVNASSYRKGKSLKDRNIDLLEFGRSNKRVVDFTNYNSADLSKLKHVCTKVEDKFIYNNDQLYDAMADAKVTICMPKTLTHPEIAQGIETLTQRYWEAMLSRMVIIGHAPKELIDVCGYNPVIELENDSSAPMSLIFDILGNIEKYQSMVDRNYYTALEKGLWDTRMNAVLEWLLSLQYKLKV